VRLLLDEHYSPEIARQLRARGHDVVAVAERPDLLGLGDDELLARMTEERRAIMTNNVKDFMPLANRAAAASDHHFGLLLTSDRSMPRRSDAIGRFVDSLDGFLQRHKDEESYRNHVQWLSPEVTDAPDGAL
jgi:predicted nuclease of predicted toxin-antitoxin system